MGIYEEAIETYGVDAQLGMVQEECAELIVAINKLKRGAPISEIANEAADVYIMLQQLSLIVGGELLDNCIEKKLKRLNKRLKAEKERQSK